MNTRRQRSMPGLNTLASGIWGSQRACESPHITALPRSCSSCQATVIPIIVDPCTGGACSGQMDIDMTESL